MWNEWKIRSISQSPRYWGQKKPKEEPKELCVFVYVCMYVRIYVRVYVRVCVRMYVRVCVLVCVHMCAICDWAYLYNSELICFSTIPDLQ